MRAIQKSKLATLFDMSESALYANARFYKEELRKLKQQGNKYNYRAVLFLAYKLGVDLSEVYPGENKEAMVKEQTEIMQMLYGNEQSKW